MLQLFASWSVAKKKRFYDTVTWISSSADQQVSSVQDRRDEHEGADGDVAIWWQGCETFISVTDTLVS
jgi:hypothetical protein